MKTPNWNDAPEWANYVAQDADGTWWWYELEPELWGMEFLPFDGTKHAFAAAGKSETATSWRDTLHRRPAKKDLRDSE